MFAYSSRAPIKLFTSASDSEALAGVVAKMSGLALYVEKQVLLVMQDGRVIVGQLRGYDPQGSLILSDSIERIFSPEDPVEEVPLGLHVVRGDAVYVASIMQ